MALLLHLLLLFLLHFSFSSADPLYNTCGGGNYTANSAYRSNLNRLLNFFSSLNSNFSTHANGSNPDTAYGLILCRGDVSPSDCRACVQNAVQDVLSLCPSSKQATVWYDNCQLRYSDLPFFSLVDVSNCGIRSNAQNVTDSPESFIRLERKLLDEITYQAAYNSPLLFATETAVNGSDVTVNGLAQCTRDLSRISCSECLKQIREVYSHQNTDFEVKKGGMVLAKSCNFRYEMLRPQPSPPFVISPPPAPSTGKKGSITTTVLVIVIPSAAALVLVLSICIFFRMRVSRRKFSGLAKLEKISYTASLLLDLSTIKAATADFSPSHKLGEGGFGSVYKGILPDGQEIAVKRLSTRSRQGMEELKNELVLVAKLQHKNLVRLRGVCLEKEEKLLIYEYVPNRSLDTFLFDQIQQKQLNWEMRFKIIGGISQGLHYLHEESHFTVIHRDLKASNILLDADMNPKISDFGLSKLFGCEEKECTTRRVVGTLGYMAPEYIARGQFSMKSDVYSFGVLLLEIVTGRKRSKFHHSGNYNDLLSYTWEHWTNGSALEILDPSVKEKFSETGVLICIQIGLLCTQEIPEDRPLMSSVLLMLNSHSVTLPAPSQPASDFRPRTNTSEISEYIAASRNNASISVLEPR